ncbi:phytanoyl-CoA dioxygenase family protein [Streptomyces sp. NPDC005438]|uniref:phytanoyl-CoA dioxygenase family protein n=1 Tax=Streptomyces sp. NPDC005438 TaxID=3156880 RepID=UPI0033AF85B5
MTPFPEQSAEPHREGGALTPTEVERFVQDGYLPLRGVFSPQVAARCREILYAEAGCSPQDPTSWQGPVVRLGGHHEPPFREAASAPRLEAAFDDLVGPGRWHPLGGLGTFPIRFPHPEAPEDDGWHIDAGFASEDPSGPPRVNLWSRGRALLLLVLLTEVGERDAPTRVRVSSHLRVPPRLRPAGAEGLSFLEVMEGLGPEVEELPEVTATGAPGDVFLCHPFLVHRAQRHRGTAPRVIAQPPLVPREEGLTLEREDGAYSPVERAVRAGLAG